MQITSANIPVPASRSHSYPAADQASARRQGIDDRGSQKKNPAAPTTQIIDAEYVELYSPPKASAKSVKQVHESTLSPEISELHSGTSVPAVTNYQVKPHEAPPPGSIIDIFA